MHQARRAIAFARAVLLLAAAAACSDLPVTPTPADGGDAAPSFAAAARTPRDVPEVRIDLPPEARPWDSDPAALQRVIEAGGGYAVVAFKEPGSARALATGRRGAVTAGTVRAGLQLLERNGAEVLELLDAIGAARVRITGAAAAALARHPLVDFVEPRQYGYVEAQTTPWGITMVNAPTFWLHTGVTGANARVEIIDTGHQQNHADLPAVPSANCSGALGGCDDGSGAGWHGTHVLGILAARDNTIGVVGVAPGIPGSSIYMYGACSSSTGSCPTDNVTAGINAGIWNVQVMNLSLRQSYDAAQATAIAQAWASGIVIVAAAGNNLSNTTVYPAAYSNVIGVSGVNSNKTFAANGTTGCGYSNYGSHVDLSAPYSAYSTIGIDTYATVCGTSMATPHVSGAAALLRSQNPGWTAQQTVDTLFARAEDVGAAGKDVYFGYGIVRAMRPVPPLSAAISGTTAVYSAGTHSWTAYASGGTGGYTYSWEYREAGGSWTAVGSGTSTYSRAVAQGDPSFELRVTVGSGVLSTSDTHSVYVNVVPPISAGITGPDTLGNGMDTDPETGTWYANASGGVGGYTYSWQYRLESSTTWTTVGSGDSYTRTAPFRGFYLRVTVSDDTGSAVDEHYVYVPWKTELGDPE